VAFHLGPPRWSGGRTSILYDRAAQKFLLCRPDTSPRQSLTQRDDGTLLRVERLGGEGERDIYLYDRQTQKTVATPGLNSKEDDFVPAWLSCRSEITSCRSSD